MTGDDTPGGTATFHLTFFCGPNSTGGFWPAATPDPPGPRNCGHGAGSAADDTAGTSARNRAESRVITGPPGNGRTPTPTREMWLRRSYTGGSVGPYNRPRPANETTRGRG